MDDADDKPCDVEQNLEKENGEPRKGTWGHIDVEQKRNYFRKERNEKMN